MSINSRHLKAILPLATLALAIGLCILLVVAQQNRKASQQVRARRVVQTPNEIIVEPGGNLQTAIESASFGDTVVLQAGATYIGPLTLPNKTGGQDAEFITIRTSNLDGIAKDGERIKPNLQGTPMARIVAPSGQPAIRTEQGAHHYKFIGIEIAPAANADYTFNLIDLGSADYNSYSQFPHHLVFDRCYVHSTGLNKARRGFALNSAETSVLNCHISGFAGAGDETQAISGWNGPGPLHIINNYLEGAGEVLLIGGADPSIPNLVPSDIEIRRNYFYKRAEWMGNATVKGTLELKNAKRVVIDGNVIETALRVTALVITVRNQNGKAPWSTIEDVEITNNVIRHASAGVNLLGSDNEHSSQEVKRIRIANNLFEDIVNPNDNAFFVQINGATSVTVENNTVQQIGNVISAYGAPTKEFTFRNNIVQHNAYGIVCQIDGPSCTDGTSCNCFPGGLITGNLISDSANVSANEAIEKKYPAGNFFVKSFDEIGFVDYRNGRWQLSDKSKYRRSNARDPGVNISALEASGVTLAKEGLPTPAR